MLRHVYYKLNFSHMTYIENPPGNLTGTQKAVKSLIFSHEINIYTCYDVDQYELNIA